ncbi:hypothetical protein PICMEDRAFT_146724 [Pichia membranifaciens NRRL Y-2026]|uniref:Ribosome-assembly protein 3 C-terminal domain-containing protein n=1 Tax=Pichia membranifaciens NRRL Y-2026 TaxID=763406 RepID=A0A1E3NIF5_9ASCO|nr:hypothetical protein PICMEDRAFT_146724 [Pichia membranifaciens NRRL Y-2026]ODQ45891.1 hypothetical protein PICMEDRAFT_146724 [Pichia membranifaciens NRRL Y-2026]
MAAGMTDKKTQAVATSSKNRRARKKRRTEISSSEEDSSDAADSSSSDDDAQDGDDAGHDSAADQQHVSAGLHAEQDAGAEIDHLRVRTRAPAPADEKTAADLVQTRLKLRQMQDLLVADGDSAGDADGAAGTVSSDAWLQLMLSQYGDDIDALRTGAGDFRAESVTLIAELLRATKDVFREV